MKNIFYIIISIIFLAFISSCERCRDKEACNYKERGSCNYFECKGCMDPMACNYDADATKDNGGCTYIACNGCTDPLAANYESWATIDDGSCTYTVPPDTIGCMDPNSCNYEATATVDDGSCEYTSCAGCMDVNGQNYNYLATIDDGSCNYDCTLTGEVWKFRVDALPVQNVDVKFEILVDGNLRMATANKTYSGAGLNFEFADLTFNAAGNNSIIEFGPTDMTMTINLYIDNVLTESTDHGSCTIRKMRYNSLNQIMVYPEYIVGGFGYDVHVAFSNVTY